MNNMSFYSDQQAIDLNPQHAGNNALTKPGSLPATTAKVKPIKRSCSVVGCTNGVVQGGVCVSHGAKRRMCLFPGCTKSSKCAGLCSKHGPSPKPCDTDGCTRMSVRGTRCKVHAEPSKKCTTVGCRKAAIIGGACKRHQVQVEVVDPIPISKGSTDPQMAIPIQACYYPASMELCQMIAPQNMSMETGMNIRPGMYAYHTMLGYPVPTSLGNLNFASAAALGCQGIPGFVNHSGARTLGFQGGMYDPRMRVMSNLAADAMMMLELSNQSRLGPPNKPSNKSRPSL